MSNASPSPDSNSPKKSSPASKSPVEGTEHDLWDFDSEDEKSPDAPKPKEKPEPTTIPSRRITESPIQSKKPTERLIDPPAVVEDEPAPKKKKTATKKSTAKKAAPVKTDTDKAATSEEKPAEETENKESDSASPDQSQNPVAPSATWKATLSKAEKIGISALIAILAIGATLSILHFSNKVPTRSILSEGLDLPIEGKLVKVTEVISYWREPITSGDDTDVVRRGTKLIPVLKIKAEAKTAAIRVLFRNEDGSVIGDPINRTIKGQAEFRIPATAGFDDIGMHAAYRTGESPPWIVQILEAKESGLSIDKFELILETEISTDIR